MHSACEADASSERPPPQSMLMPYPPSLAFVQSQSRPFSASVSESRRFPDGTHEAPFPPPPPELLLQPTAIAPTTNIATISPFMTPPIGLTRVFQTPRAI